MKIENGFAMKIEQINTTSCYTIYDVDGTKLRLFIITGGTPAIEFADDYSFCQRYPSFEHWSDKYYHRYNGSTVINSYYDHQDPNNIQGPKFEDVLPHGLKDVEKYLKKNLPLRNLRYKRHDRLPIRTVIKSKRVHDKDEGTYVTCELNLLSKHYVPLVTFNSKVYSGRCDKKIVLFNDWWKKSQEIFNTIFDSGKVWETLSEEEYETIVEHLSKF